MKVLNGIVVNILNDFAVIVLNHICNCVFYFYM